jgi:hypothetical protein
MYRYICNIPSHQILGAYLQWFISYCYSTESKKKKKIFIWLPCYCFIFYKNTTLTEVVYFSKKYYYTTF